MKAVCESFHLAKDAGFKVVAHMMPDLPNMGLERDMDQFFVSIPSNNHEIPVFSSFSVENFAFFARLPRRAGLFLKDNLKLFFLGGKVGEKKLLSSCFIQKMISLSHESLSHSGPCGKQLFPRFLGLLLFVSQGGFLPRI